MADNQKDNQKNTRRGFLRKTAQGGFAALALGSFSARADDLSGIPGNKSAVARPAIKPDYFIKTVPENMVAGYFGADVPPIARVKDGAVVEIQTVGAVGISKTDPESFFKNNNLPVDAHALEIIKIQKEVKPEPSGIRGHMLTGPIYIEGAEPGDMLEVRVLDLSIRSMYGVNMVRPGGGGIPDDITTPNAFIYRYDSRKKTGTFKEGVEIPLRPFMGVMGVSPPPEKGRVSSIAPGNFGGNLDIRHLTVGSTLYLPVSVPGALFTTGDCHTAQGNGEVSGTAIEGSLTMIAKFIVHKGKTIKVPRAENATHFIAIGLDPDLRIAMKNAIRETCNFISTEIGGFTFNEALSIASTGVEFEVSQVVDQTLGVHGMIPKSIFTKKKFDYWT
ncbi:acetamidase/formamidase family protein [Dyadobacter sp. NIV53]|uniref:acetamidase/formamidase family protein n=1 Tax=Dyadobacter sp. NIV53 TaxID=2861765 RepID=UPI001C87BBBD|nr:acetamidase/formamidase family protein [Dyadobacter sp. NIV53]